MVAVMDDFLTSTEVAEATGLSPRRVVGIALERGIGRRVTRGEHTVLYLFTPAEAATIKRLRAPKQPREGKDT